MILEGTAIAEINKKKYIKKGEVSWIPAKIPHRFMNKKKEKLKIYWTYAKMQQELMY